MRELSVGDCLCVFVFQVFHVEHMGMFDYKGRVQLMWCMAAMKCDVEVDGAAAGRQTMTDRNVAQSARCEQKKGLTEIEAQKC